MADKTLRSITFPGLTDRYVIPEPDVNADLWYDSGLWIEGHLISSDGAFSADPTYNRMCTPELIPANVTRIKVQDGYRIIPYCWSADGSTYLGIWNGSAPVKAWNESNWLTGTVDLKAISTAYRFKLLAQQVGNQRQLVPATDADKFVFVSFTDETLTIGGKAADAKATGERIAAVDSEIEEINDAIEDIGADIDEIDERFDTKAPIIILEASGSVASFSDGADGLPMKSLVAAIEPVQDLHGYDHPWPAGSGKNKAAEVAARTFAGITLTVKNNGEVVANGTATQDVVFNGEYFVAEAGNYYLNGCPDGGNLTNTYDVFMWDVTNSARPFRWNGTTAADSVFNSSEQAEVKIEAGHQYSTRIRIRSGYNANNVVFRPMLRLSTEADATFEPYSNICQISGWTGLSGKRTGKNLVPFTNGTRSNAGVTFVFTNGVITANGTATGTAMSGTTDLYLNAGTYRILNISEQTSGAYVSVQNSEESTSWPIIARTAALGDSITDTFILTRRTKVSVRARIPSGVTATNMVFKPMLVAGTDATTEFEPYTAKSISVNWQSQAGEVYHGTLDIISGKLVVDHAKMIVDGDRTLYSLLARTKTVRFAVVANPRMSQIVRAAIPVKSDVLPTPTSFDFYNSDKLGVCGWSSAENETPGLWMSIPIEAGSTNESVKAWLNTNPITCVYPIASPVEYQLTPHEVTTLLGNNVVYTDVGPVTVDYPADTTIVVSQQKNAISQLEGQVVTDVTVTGAIVTITAEANKRYLCGTVASIDVTPCVSGAFDLIFTSGSTAAVLTIPNTVKWQDSSFDPTALDTDTIYEISVADGTLGLVAKWT